MLAFGLAKFLSPRVLLGLAAAIILGLGIIRGIHFLNGYIVLEKQTVLLQQSVAQAQQALVAQTQAAEQQHAVDQQDLDALRVHDTMQTQIVASTQNDLKLLKSLGKPTNADVKCDKSRYISSILKRLRQRDQPPAADPHSLQTDRTDSTAGVNNLLASTPGASGSSQ